MVLLFLRFILHLVNAPNGISFVVITGFHRDLDIHNCGISPVALSQSDMEQGKSWKRVGRKINFWKSVSGDTPEYTLSFTFSVKTLDTMYFAYTYPYTFTYLIKFLETLTEFVKHNLTACSTATSASPSQH